MAIKLLKPIKREMLSREQNGKHRGRAVIVELLPGDEIGFRVKGTRTQYTAYLGHCYRLALILTLEREYKEKYDAYLKAKKQGKRVRRPKRPQLPFNKIYFDATK
jgi:hypothetical protein